MSWHEFEMTLNSPLTKEDWSKITDANMEHTKSVTFQTGGGKKAEFIRVVRCKDCRYWRQKVSPTEHWVCAHHSFNERKMYTMPDFYCADGEDKA